MPVRGVYGLSSVTSSHGLSWLLLLVAVREGVREWKWVEVSNPLMGARGAERVKTGGERLLVAREEQR